MATLIALAAIGLFIAGAATGIIGVVWAAIRRKDKNLTLTQPGHRQRDPGWDGG